MQPSKPAPITVDSTGGEILSVVGDNYRVLVSGKQTNGAFETIDMLSRRKAVPVRIHMPAFMKRFMLLTEREGFVYLLNPFDIQYVMRILFLTHRNTHHFFVGINCKSYNTNIAIMALK